MGFRKTCSMFHDIWVSLRIYDDWLREIEQISIVVENKVSYFSSSTLRELNTYLRKSLIQYSHPEVRKYVNIENENK